MEYVYAQIKGEAEPCFLNIETIRQGKVLEKDIIKMWCTNCGAPAHVYHHESGLVSFRSIPHRDGCPTQSKEWEQDERLLVKQKRIYTDTVLNRELILYGNDRAPVVNPDIDYSDDEEKGEDGNSVEGNTEENPGAIVPGDNNLIMYDPDQLEKRELAIWYRFKTKILSCIKSLFREIMSVGYSFNMGDGKTAADYVLDNIALHEVRRTGIGKKEVIAIAKRCAPEDMAYLRKIGLLSPGKHNLDYIILKDAYSTNIENAIFFKVKCKNQAQNEHFKNLIMGSKKNSINKDNRKFIVIYSFFEQEPNDYNQVYVAEITLRQYGLFSNVDIGGKR